MFKVWILFVAVTFGRYVILMARTVGIDLLFLAGIFIF